MGILIDAKVIPVRKCYLIFFSTMVAVSEGLIASHLVKKDNIDYLVALLFIDAFA